MRPKAIVAKALIKILHFFIIQTFMKTELYLCECTGYIYMGNESES